MNGWHKRSFFSRDKALARGMDKGFRIALMCAGKQPLECHRTILVARHLAKRGIDVQHIHVNGHLEIQAHAMRRLSQMVGLETSMDRHVQLAGSVAG